MPQIWNPTEVLQLCNDGRCVGYAPSKRRKCQVPIGRARYEALITELAGQEPDVEALASTLVELAKWALCARFHQSQTNDMVHKWSSLIRAACVRSQQSEIDDLRELISLSMQRHIDAWWSALLSSSSSRSTSRFSVSDVSELRSSTSSTVQSPGISQRPFATNSLTGNQTPSTPTIARGEQVTPPSTRIVVMRQPRTDPVTSPGVTTREPVSPPASSRSVTPPRSATPSSTTSGVTSREVESSPASRQSSTSSTYSTPLTPSPTFPAATPREPTSPSLSPLFPTPFRLAPRPVAPPAVAVPEPVTPPSLRQTTPLFSSPFMTGPHRPTSANHCDRTHVRRLPLNEECAICYDDIPLSQCNPADLVWCRSGCGRSVHADCFNTWRSQHSASTPVKCVICRTPWAADCECTEGCAATHVRRRAANGECSICRDDLRPLEHVGTTPPSLSWCKNGCGRSVHSECFEIWQAECTSRGRTATCTDCRASWAPDCEC